MDRPRPTKLGHLVLKVRDVHVSVKFYVEVVGLQVSDWIDDHMVFLRAGADHHDLALLQMTPAEIAQSLTTQSRVEHFSYQLRNVDEMRAAVRMLRELNIPIDRGFGKHGPGDNTFLVFNDPDGNNVEFYSDMIQIDAAHPYTPRVWPGGEIETFDQWRLSEFVVAPPERIARLLETAKTPDA
ncbi:MAG TPA: VOC family protein [Alphaproteobacteria bacterium]|nr:VOC family protein [Alphaproteobacteria bacterium]